MFGTRAGQGQIIKTWRENSSTLRWHFAGGRVCSIEDKPRKRSIKYEAEHDFFRSYFGNSGWNRLFLVFNLCADHMDFGRQVLSPRIQRLAGRPVLDRGRSHRRPDVWMRATARTGPFGRGHAL